MSRRRKQSEESIEKEVVKFKPLTKNQEYLAREIREKTVCFVVGPAGAGKTFTCAALAAEHLLSGKVKQIVISRPLVATEQCGFLPGDLESKIAPYLFPLFNELEYFVNVKSLVSQKKIVIAPIAFMQGCTYKDSFVILDEAQNMTYEQIKLVLTRLGSNSKMIFNGDLSSSYLPNAQKGGLNICMSRLYGLEDVGIIRLTSKDIVRHPLIEIMLSRLD